MTFLSTLKKQATVAGDVLNSKGDLLSRTASVLARLAVGSDGKVLTAKASEATGLSWETPTDENPTTTKGDLSGFSDEIARVPIGTNTHILTADSGEVLGLKWSAPVDQNPTTTKGDLSGFSDEEERVPIGTNFYTLQAKSGVDLGLAWLPSSTSVLTTAGDLLYASGANTLARLAKGTDNQVLKMNGSALNWETPATSGVTTNVQTSEITANKTITSTSYVTTGITNTLSNQSGGVAIANSAIAAVHNGTNIDNHWAYADDGTTVVLETLMNNQATAANRKNPNPTWSMSTDGSALAIYSKVDSGQVTMIANFCNHVVTEIY